MVNLKHVPTDLALAMTGGKPVVHIEDLMGIEDRAIALFNASGLMHAQLVCASSADRRAIEMATNAFVQSDQRFFIDAALKVHDGLARLGVRHNSAKEKHVKNTLTNAITYCREHALLHEMYLSNIENLRDIRNYFAHDLNAETLASECLADEVQKFKQINSQMLVAFVGEAKSIIDGDIPLFALFSSAARVPKIEGVKDFLGSGDISHLSIAGMNGLHLMMKMMQVLCFHVITEELDKNAQ